MIEIDGFQSNYNAFLEEEDKKENNDDRTELINHLVEIKSKNNKVSDNSNEKKLSAVATTVTYNEKKQEKLNINFIVDNNNNIKKNDIIMLNKKRGRKKKLDNNEENMDKEHNKYSDDNIRRKIKHIVLKKLLEFINQKIETMYTHINRGIFTKKLMTIQQYQISNATILYNKNFLNKKIGDIFSVDISKRYTNYLPNHNKTLILSLINDEDINKKEYFKGLFDLTFLECLKHFRGTIDNYYLQGYGNFEEEMNKLGEKDYINAIKTYINNYENIIGNKKERLCMNEDD